MSPVNIERALICAKDWLAGRRPPSLRERDALATADVLAWAVLYFAERQQEHLALIARISQTTPLAIELEGWEAQRSALIAEVGTLRARVAELERTCSGLNGGLDGFGRAQ